VFSFEIGRPWYASPAAIAGYALLFAAAIYLVRLYNQRRLIRHQRKIERTMLAEQEELRRKEAEENEQQIIRIRNEQLQADLDSKSRELTNSAMNIVYKNELMQRISEEIHQLRDDSGKKLSDDRLKRIQKVIDEGMTNERDWNLFENSFNETHESFFKKLKHDHPDLVPNDLKLCAYLRMNMNSKEIASLLNITVRGVEIRRYRLRKKLAIPHDKNLVEFLMEL
jgi:DNA-binding CsgD family transcriptional regulator